jgi:hypothetical protein
MPGTNNGKGADIKHMGSASPRQRLHYFLEIVEPKVLASATIHEVVVLALEEFKSLASEILPEALGKQVTTPAFLKKLEENENAAFEELTVAQVQQLNSCFGLQGGQQTLATQFIIDGLDDWLTRQDISRIKNFLLACGVQPAMANTAASAARDKLNDFIITLIFPEKDEQETYGDWLANIKAKNEAVTVEDFYATPVPERTPTPVPSGAEGVQGTDETPKSRKRERETGVDDNGDLIITAENLPELMRTRPEVIPKDILKANRKPIAAGITEFELINHYSMDELRSFISEKSITLAKKKLKTDLAQGILAHLAPK